MFDYTRAQATDHGVILDLETGVGLFSDAGSPVGKDAPIRSYYFDSTDGLMYFKFGAGVNDWRAVRPGFFQDHTVLFTSFKTGSNFNKNAWERLCVGHLEGTNLAPPNTQYLLTLIASQSGNSSVDIRLIRSDTGVQLGTIVNFTETVLTFKSMVFTPPAGDIIVELEGMKNGNSVGELFWAAIETKRIAL